MKKSLKHGHFFFLVCFVFLNFCVVACTAKNKDEPQENRVAIEKDLFESNENNITENDYDENEISFEDEESFLLLDEEVETNLLEESGIVFFDSNSNVRKISYSYYGENFIPESKTDGQVLISTDGNRIKRSFYDDNFRLIKREDWMISGLKNSIVTKTEEYVYNQSSLLPSQKLVTTKDEIVKTYYNDDGLPIKFENYTFADNDKEGNDKDKKTKYLKSSIEWNYNSDGKILSEATANYEYKNDNYSKPSKIRRKKEVYDYHEDEEIPPDYQYFENGKLQTRTVYTSKDEYRTDTFFDSNYTVRTFYVDSKKIREVYYQDGKVIRTKDYE